MDEEEAYGCVAAPVYHDHHWRVDERRRDAHGDPAKRRVAADAAGAGARRWDCAGDLLRVRDLESTANAACAGRLFGSGIVTEIPSDEPATAAKIAAAAVACRR